MCCVDVTPHRRRYRSMICFLDCFARMVQLHVNCGQDIARALRDWQEALDIHLDSIVPCAIDR